MENVYVEGVCRVFVFGGLFVSFFLLFRWFMSERLLRSLLQSTTMSIDRAASRRMKENRQRLALMDARKGWILKMEQKLLYSGLAIRWRWLTPEIWILGDLLLSAAVYFTVSVIAAWYAGLGAILILQLFLYFAEGMLMSRNYRRVNDNMLKFLDFLGNYSITAQEVTAVLSQISRFMEEPLKTVLEECSFEAQTTGDTSLALLSMADKIEHPCFKELVRNMEVCVRYSTDFTELVKNSRRAIRDHMRTRQERKGMVGEALVNMVILLIMSVVVLAAVQMLIGADMKQVMLQTFPGRVSLGMMGGIFLLFYRQVRKLDQ